MGKKYSIGAALPKNNKYTCDWKGCKPNNHDTKLEYPEGGVVERDEYTGIWIHPSALYPQKSFKKYHLVYWKKIGKKYKTYVDRYPVRNHHVIPVNIMGKSLDTIPHNLKLLTWDMNDGGLNGICLPFNNEDICWHGLQAHRGSHPSYDQRVESALGNLEAKCKKFCTKNQDKLVSDIAKKVKEFKENIINWTWVLHANSEQYK